MAEPKKIKEKPVEKRVRVKATKEEIIAAETKGEFKINKIKTTLTTEDIKGIPPTIQINTPQTTITANYVIEKIPIPTVNSLSSLSNSSDIWNKTTEYYDDENEVLVFAAKEENIVSSGGQSTKVRVFGDNNAAFKLTVKDITNIKWYNWETEQFENGYNTMEGIANYGASTLTIPPQAEETTYNIFFENIGSTTPDVSLPTEEYPWVINQLPNPKITFKFDDESGFNSELTTTFSHVANDILNSGTSNDGIINVSVTTVATRGIIAIKDGKEKVTIADIESDDNTEIITTDLKASVSSDARTGTISGTVIIGKSGHRDSDIMFYPKNTFTIT